MPDGLGGVVVQQSTEDADAEVWNLVYSDPFATRLLNSGRLAFGWRFDRCCTHARLRNAACSTGV